MSVAQNLTALSPTTYASQSPKNTQFWNPIKFRLVLYLGLMKRFWRKGTGCRFYTPHDGQHFNFGSTNNFFRHCCPWHKCAWRQIISKREVFFHPGISSWKGLKLSSKGTSSFSLFFLNLSNQFGSYSISDHDDEFNITTKKTRMVHMHTLLNFQL